MGSSITATVAVASIAAKVTRDRFMRSLAGRFPAYDFASNKGYGSPKHLRALEERGPAEIHRPRFLRRILGEEGEDASEESPQTLLNFE